MNPKTKQLLTAFKAASSQYDKVKQEEQPSRLKKLYAEGLNEARRELKGHLKSTPK